MTGSKQSPPTNFYKYVTASTAKLILINQSLRWSSPLVFNDIFDVPPDLPLFSANDVARASVPFAFRLFEKMGFPIHPDGREAALTLCMSQDLLTPEEAARIQENFTELQKKWAKMVPTMRILCLCERPDVAAMWGLYADSNRGVALRFESIHSFNPPWLEARPIIYSDDLPRYLRPDGIIEAVHEGPQTIFDDLCYSKTPDWSSEREWRVLSFARPIETGLTSDWHFFPQTLTEVILGPRISEEDRRDISALLAHDFSHVELSQARPTSEKRIEIKSERSIFKN